MSPLDSYRSGCFFNVSPLAFYRSGCFFNVSPLASHISRCFLMWVPLLLTDRGVFTPLYLQNRAYAHLEILLWLMFHLIVLLIIKKSLKFEVQKIGEITFAITLLNNNNKTPYIFDQSFIFLYIIYVFHIFCSYNHYTSTYLNWNSR